MLGPPPPPTLPVRYLTPHPLFLIHTSPHLTLTRALVLATRPLNAMPLGLIPHRPNPHPRATAPPCLQER